MLLIISNNTIESNETTTIQGHNVIVYIEQRLLSFI